MADLKFSDAFLETAFRALMLNNCKTEQEIQMFAALCEVCDKHHISVKTFTDVSSELTERLKEISESD